MAYSDRLEFHGASSDTVHLEGWIPWDELSGSTFNSKVLSIADKLKHKDRFSVVLRDAETGVTRSASFMYIVPSVCEDFRKVWYLSKDAAVKPLGRAIKPTSYNGV